MSDNDSGSPRVRRHGEQMGAETEMNGEDYSPVHCCSCWRYTDDLGIEARLISDATSVLVNGNTLCVEKSEAWNAANEFLAYRFRQAMKPKLPPF